MIENKNNGKAIIFSAPSGAGKTTIVHYLLRQNLNLKFSISATTRKKRPAEKDERDYYFLSVPKFKAKIENKDFVEWEEVYTDHFYGTLLSEVENIWSEGKHVIFDVDVVGGISLKRFFKDKALSVFVKPPGISTLRERLEKRHTETEKSIERRIAKAEIELKYAKHFDYILVNDDLPTAFEEATNVIKEFISQ